jgi:hypothetical protein
MCNSKLQEEFMASFAIIKISPLFSKGTKQVYINWRLLNHALLYEPYIYIYIYI